MTEAPWTIASVLRWATADFAKRGLDSPKLEAELLLAHALDLDRLRLILDAQRELSPEELTRYRRLIVERRSGVPSAYLLGRREFFGHVFRVDARVLIPRPDTEALVEEALARTSHRALSGRALDLCTGSGCVAISFALARPTWHVLASDVSEPAARLALENAQRLGAAFNTSVIVSSLYSALPPAARFELITANPPYIPSRDVDQLDPGIREQEPRLALDGGADGLELVRQIVGEAPRWLRPGGALALELQFDQAERVEHLLERAGFIDVRRRRDYGGHERVVSGVLPA